MTHEEPQHSTCLPCRRGRCLGCLWRTRLCGHDCAWLRADMLTNFPSLRRKALKEKP